MAICIQHTPSKFENDIWQWYEQLNYWMYRDFLGCRLRDLITEHRIHTLLIDKLIRATSSKSSC